MMARVHLFCAFAVLATWIAFRLSGEITPLESWCMIIIFTLHQCTFTLAHQRDA